MAIKNKAGEWLDPRGRAIPESYVPDLDKKKDRLIEQSIKEMKTLEKKMRETKVKIMARIEKYKEQVGAALEVENTGKGNLTLTGFSGDKQIEFAMNDILEFDEKLQFAKAMIDQCIKKWSEGSNQNLRVVIDQAFEIDKKGKVNSQAIFKLRQLKINDPDWKKAMELIADSLTVSGTRQYLIMRERKSAAEKFKTINLNFSSI